MGFPAIHRWSLFDRSAADNKRRNGTSVSPSLSEDYDHCAMIARHYENFVVASLLLPLNLRPHFLALYAYCRTVDDIGDEASGDRMALLEAWEQRFRAATLGHPDDSLFRALAHTIAANDLPLQPFYALIEANRQDQRIQRYATFEDVLAYCRLSAEPVGQLVLALWGYRDPERVRLSNRICTALQLANFLQDLSRDLEVGRHYLPVEDLERFSCDLANPDPDAASRLLAFEISRVRQGFAEGAKLEQLVPRRLAFQLRLYRLGGQAILDAVSRLGPRVFRQRPRVTYGPRFRIAVQSLWMSGFGGPRRRVSL